MMVCRGCSAMQRSVLLNAEYNEEKQTINKEPLAPCALQLLHAHS